MESLDDFNQAHDISDRQKEFLNEASKKMAEADTFDKTLHKQMLKEKKKERKRKEKQSLREENSSTPVVLGNAPEQAEQDEELSENSDNFSEGSKFEAESEDHSKKRSITKDDNQKIYKKIKKDMATADRKTLEDMALALLQK